MDTIILKTDAFHMTEDEFFEFCQQNKELNIERDADQNIIIISPTGTESGFYNGNIYTQLALWNRQTKLGVTFESSAGFLLPNGAVRSPDAAWIPKEQYFSFDKKSRQKFIPYCPDFIIELKSPSDNLKDLQKKMEEWVANGTRLGWLIDPETQTSYIYHQDSSQEILQGFYRSLSGENVLPGFVLDLKELLEE